MATQKALVFDNGTQEQIDNADTLLVGAAIDKSSTGTLVIGGTIATAITIGSAGITTTFPGSLSVEGNVTLGNAASDNISFVGQVDTSTTWEAISAPPVSPAGTGRIYFDSSSNTFKLSENGGAYVEFVGSNGSGTVTSVDISGGTTGLSFSGGPITTSGSFTVSGTLAVANGGTGAASLTGYVKGNGTSAFTASSTIPGSDISGNILGNAANVTGTVAVANGGTGSASLTANNVLLGNGTSALQVVAPGASGNLLTSNGTTWTSQAPAAITVEYLVIGGGGAGGSTASNGTSGGGGGAGGYVSSSCFPPATFFLGTAYSVLVGAGGSSGTGATASTSGNASVFYRITAAGGGRGAGGSTGTVYAALIGGSGGGGSSVGSNGSAAGVKVRGFGTSGGGGQSGLSQGGGGAGGGAGGSGGGTSTTVGGVGGRGAYSSITGSSVGRAGGGGGAAQTSGDLGTASEGGGAGGYSTTTGTGGTANTGGGGGGAYYNKASGAGGSGIVILKYLSTYTATFSAGVTQSTTTSGGYKISEITAAGATDTVTFS